MRVRGAAVVAAVLVLAGCGGSKPSGSHASPTPSASATASPSGAPTATSTGGPGPAPLVHCATTVPAGDNLVIGTVVGDPTVVVRDIQDPANAKNLCTFDPSVISPGFADASNVVYITADHEIVEAPLGGGSTTVLASFSATAINSGQYALSPDGKSLTYLDGNTWHLEGAGGNKVLTTLPAVPGRGINPDEDDSYLAYSPDGQYIALFQTFHVGGTGETAPDQVRKADGTLVYSTSGMTMAVWASVPSRLFFRDSTGNVHRWDPSTGPSAMTSLHWIRPRSSPDGRWIAYAFPATSGVHGVGFYSVQANSQQNTSPPGRAGVVFLTNDLVWYFGEKPCSVNCGPGQSATPTGVSYIYSIAGTSEVTSRLASVDDAWPHVTAPGL